MSRGAAGLAVLAALALVAYPWVMRSNYAINVGFLVLFAAYLGQTWNIAGGFAGQTSFGHAAFFGVGAYASTILHVTFAVNPWLAWPLATIAGGLTGWLMAALSFRAGLKGSYFALITLAFAEVGRIVANSLPLTRGGLGMLIKADPRPENFQFKDPAAFYYLGLALCALSLVVAWQLTRTRFGARLAAIRENEDAAAALGIDTFREKCKCLALSGALCGAGGTVYAQKYLYIDPSIAFSVDKSVEMLLVTMIGGAGTVLGPLIGSGVLHLVGELTGELGNMLPGVQNAQPLSVIVYGAILIVIVAWLPDGLMGLFRRPSKPAKTGAAGA
jgi:branched-chain amino acid transport system permease protein